MSPRAQLAVRTESALMAPEALELEVPFFMYNPDKFSLYSDCDRTTFGNTKHSAALYFFDRVRTSKWRTLDMRKAKLAIVPVLLDWFAHGLCNGTEAKHVANTSRVIGSHASKFPHVVIAASFASMTILPKLQVVLPSLRVGTYVAVGAWPASMPQGHDFVTGPCGFHIGFTTYHDTFSHAAPWNRARHASGLKIPGCEGKSLASDPANFNCSEWNWDPSRKLPSTPSEEHYGYFEGSDINAPRQYELEFVGQVDNRTGYTDRWKFLHSRGHMNFHSKWYVMSSTNASLSNLSQCTDTRRIGTYCGGVWQDYAETQRVRENSEFSLMLRGDDQASDRLQNAVASLTIPIVVEDNGMGGGGFEWLPFSHAINWDDIIVVVRRKAFNKNASAAVLEAIGSLDEVQRAARRQIMLEARREFLWDYPGSRVHERILQAAVLETEGWSPGCDVSALEYQAALRTGRMNALPMPTYGYEQSNAATERLARRAAAEASKAKRALRGPDVVSPPPTAKPVASPTAEPTVKPTVKPTAKLPAKPAAKPKRHSDETGVAAERPSRPLAPDPAMSPASTDSGGRDAWLAMPGDGSETVSEREIVFVVDKV
jgi:hypothetical protein